MRVNFVNATILQNAMILQSLIYILTEHSLLLPTGVLRFKKTIKDSAKNMFDVIIVWKLDRFARNHYDSAHYKAQIRKNGVKVIFANENISEGSEGMAEYYSADLSEKVIRGLTENAMKCKFNSDPITFGFNFEPTAITSEHSCSEAFLCPNPAFYGGVRVFFLCLKISRESLRDSKRQQILTF